MEKESNKGNIFYFFKSIVLILNSLVYLIEQAGGLHKSLNFYRNSVYKGFKTKGDQHMSTKSTGPKAAKKASTVLASPSTGKSSKSAAGSTLAQVNPAKVTSMKAATAASKVLREGRTGSASKTAAGSALSQTPSKKFASTASGTSSGGPRKPKK